MEHKNKSFSRIKRHQSDKVLRYSIRKYSFGAASVAVAALMFLGTHVVSADGVDHQNQPAIGAPNPNEEESPLIEPAPTSKNEETKETEKVEVAKETEEREKPSENKEAVEANSLNNGTSTSAIIATKDASADKVAEKQTLDKTKLQANITKVQELLDKVNKEKAPASTLAAIQADLENAKNALNNNELTQAEIDTIAKKLNEKSFVLSSMPKLGAPKIGNDKTRVTPKTETEIKHSLETVKEDLQKYVKKSEITTDKPNVTAAEEILENISKQLENTTLTSKELTTLLEQAKTVRNSLVNEELRATSGARDSRNTQRMGEGVSFRADDVVVEGALHDVKEYISEDKYNGGGTTTNQRVRTIEKTFMTAKYSTEGNKKFITYEVYFQNDGQALDGTTGNAFWFYPPRDLLYNVGDNYPIGLVSDAYYERYEKKAGTTGILSHNPNNFTQVGGRYTVSLSRGKTQDYGSQSLWGSAGGIFQFDGGPARRSPRQVQSMLKNLQYNKELNSIIRLGNNPTGNLPDGSYSHILNVSPKQNYAYKYHVKMRLRDDVTAEQAKTAGTIAVTTKAGSATNALQAYVYAARGTSLLAPPTINTLTKYDGTLVSTDRVISGTGVAGATITLTMQDGTPRTIHVDNSGRWSYTLKQNEKLTQNTRQDASIKSPNTISAKQTKNGEESSVTAVNVQLARAISIDTPLQAGRDISVKVAHDTGRFYIQVRNAANTATVYEYGVIQENGRWRIENSTAANAIDVKVTDGDTPSEKKITLHVNDSHRKNNIPFKITKDHVVRVRSHHVNDANIAADPGHENDGWVTAAKATNTNPTIAIKDSNATYTSDGTLTKDKLKTLVTVNDAEDTPGKTVGNSAAENLDVTATKDGKNVDLTKPLKQGTYNLTYRTTDAAGAIATKNHTITVNYAAVAKSKINLVQGERVSDEIKRSLLELRDGNDKVAIPNNARVEVTLDTSAKADSKTAVASVVLQGKTIASTNINYRVLPTFPIAHTVYDFKGVNRSDDESKYYLNTGIPGGMKWFAKRGNEAEIDASGLRDKINADPVGETTYKFGGKYNYGRFTDSPQPTEKLEHSATFTHKVFDIKPNDTKVTVAQGGTLSEAQAISAVAKVTGSPDLPSGTTYEWVDDRGNKITPTANTAGVQNFKVKVTLPPAQSGNDAPEATKRQPSKIITVPVNVTPPAPTVTPTINNMVTSTDRVLRGTGLAGAKVKVTVNTTPLPEVTVGRDGNWEVTLPKGLNSNHAPSQAQLVNKDPLKVTQSVDGVDSPITNVTVAVGETKVQPTVENGTSVYAGAKMITVKAPHDAGVFYVKYREKDSNQEKEIGIKRDSISGPWTSIAPDRGVVTGNVTKDGFSDTVTIEMKESIKEGSISAVANIRQGGYSSPYSWQATTVTNEAPTLTSTFTGPKKVVEYGTPFNPTELVRASDKEDDTGLTRGTGRVEVVSVNGNTGNKTVNTSQTGTYTVKLKATDSQGKASAEKDVTVEVTKNHQAVAKPVVNLKVGETLTPAEKRSLIELQEGNGRVALPDDAIVEVNLDTSAKSNSKQTTANVRFKDGTVKNVDLNYKVLQTFPVATKVYDFNGVARNQSEGAYYSNTGLPDGFNWFVRQNGTVKPDGYIQNYLRNDSVGTTDYVYGAKYREGRFSNNAPESDRLEHSGTVSHTVFDVGANTTRIMVNRGSALSDDQARTAVMPINNSAALPSGTTYEWVTENGNPLTDKAVTEKGEATRYVKVTLPKTAVDGPAATQHQSYKIVEVKINEAEKPTVSFKYGNDTIPLTTTAENRFVIFRGATFNPTLTVSDNSGTVSYLKVSGLPSGREVIKDTAMTSGTNVTIDGDNATTSNADLGRHEASVLVRDAAGNEETYKFAYTVEDAILKETPKTVPLGTKLGTDSHDYVKLANSTEPDYTVYPNGMAFKWKKDNVEVTDRETALTEPGRVTGYKAVVKFPAAGFYTKNGVKIYTPDSIERDITFLVQPTAPTVTAKDNGDVLITPTNQTNVDKVSVTFTKQDDSTEVTYTAKKNASGVWQFGSGAPLTVDPTTGVFRLKDRVVKDGTTVTTKALTTDGTGSVESIPATGIAGNGDAVLPEIEFKNTVIDSTGDRVVYITPIENTNIDVATITDNSNKLLEAVFFDQGAGITDLGNYGLTYNKVIRNGDTITNAPLTVTVNGTLNKFKSGNTVWSDDDVITTRYASAMDAAENNIKDKSGSRDNVASNPYRVVFKTLTQATKYTPTVSKSKIERDITQANTTITATEFNKIKDTLTFSSTRGEVKVDKNTSGLELTMKNSTVQTKQDGTLYITATVTYPDGSREDIEVPLDTTNANKAKPTLTIPEVSIKAAKAKDAQGSVPATEYNRVLNNVTVPQGQPQPTAKEVKNNGRISVVGGKNVVTVGLTFSDNTKKDVTVPVLEVKPIDITTTFNELDNTVTVKPNTTVENGDKLHVTIRGIGMQLTKTADGYTNSVNDRTITVNQDGSITITLAGEEKYQAGDRIVTRHESNKNGKVDSYETEAFAGLKPVEKVPVINLTNLTPKEIEDVKAAVEKANPSVNTAELQVAANGDVTYRHKGAGVGASDPTPVITLSETVRERNDAEKIDPTIATLTRYVKETKHTDEQIKNAITGEHIANKAITGEIPTNGGTVVVKVTYTDGSSEDVKVPIIVTPELTPVKNLNDLTNKEKESVKAKIQTLNPTATNIVVKNNGETTLTIPDVTTAPLTPAQTVKEADSNRIQPPAVTPVKNTGALTPEEKGKVVEAVKKVNPKATKVEVGEDGSTTVTFEDGTTAPLTPAQTVKEADSNRIQPPAVTPVKNTGALTPEEKGKVVEAVKKVNPKATKVEVGEDGSTTVTFEDGTTAPLTPDKTVVEAQSNGLIDPPTVEIPEFNGAVNGELPDPVELPKVKLIITKWIDEQGNELKPADAKAPAVLGEANEAFEHGEIEGYVFVRTDVNEEGDVVTHVFRKVTPTKPEGNGEQQGGDNTPQSTPEVPTDNTERKPETEKPTVPDTKQAEQPTQTVDAQVAPSQNQAVLPNTGTKADRATGALGALSLLGAFGLLFAKKKKDDEEETRNN